MFRYALGTENAYAKPLAVIAKANETEDWQREGFALWRPL